MSRKKPWWKRYSGVTAVLSGALSGCIGLFWNLERWIGLAGLPGDSNSLYLWGNALISLVPPQVYWMTLGATLMLGLAASVVYISHHWDSMQSRVLILPWACRYVRITAVGKVPVYYRFAVTKGLGGRKPLSIRRIKKGQTTDIRFNIPQEAHQFRLVIEVPPIYKLLFPSSRSDVEWIETMASNGRRRYKSAFVNSRRKSSEWARIMVVNRYGEAGWGAVRESLKGSPSVWSLANRGRGVEMIAPPPPTFEELLEQAQEQSRCTAQEDSDS